MKNWHGSFTKHRKYTRYDQNSNKLYVFIVDNIFRRLKFSLCQRDSEALLPKWQTKSALQPNICKNELLTFFVWFAYIITLFRLLDDIQIRSQTLAQNLSILNGTSDFPSSPLKDFDNRLVYFSIQCIFINSILTFLLLDLRACWWN